MLVGGKPRERGRRETSLEGSRDTGFVRMLVWRFFTALLQNLGWGMGKRGLGLPVGATQHPGASSQLVLSHDSFQAGCSFRRKRCRYRTVP